MTAYAGTADAAHGDPAGLVGEPVRPALAAHGGLLRARRARGLHPCAARLRHRQRRDARRSRSGRGEGRPVDAVLPASALPPRGRRGRSENPARRADVRPFRDPAARHDPHPAARPSGVRHRLDQPAQRKARTRQFHARGLYPAPDRLHRLHRRGLPCRGGLPADGLGARRLRRAGAGPFERPAREPHPDGGADRRPRRADQGQRARAGKADRMVPHQHDRRRAGQVRGRRAAGLSGLPAALRLHEHERRPAHEILRRPLPRTASPATWRRRTPSATSTRNISRSWT